MASLLPLVLLLSCQVAYSSPHTTLRDYLNIFDLAQIEDGFSDSNTDVSEQCALDVDKLLQALREHKAWALKAYDASGRYSSGFFWGNGYWLGSETLCLNIEAPMKQYEVLGDTPTTMSNKTFTEEQAPVDLGFYKVRNLLKLPSTISQPRTIFLGLCLPLSCSGKDVKTLVNMQASKSNITVAIQRVKTPHETYSFFKDPVFWILAITSLAVYILLLTGTILDYFMEWKEEKLREEQYVNKNFITTEASVKLPTNSLNFERDLPAMGASKYDKNSNSVNLVTGDRSSVSSAQDSEPYMWQQLLLAFSVRRNIKTIWDRSVGEDTIPTVHGIRFFSMCWVVMGHTCIIIFKYSDNMEFRGLMERQWLFQTVTNAPFAVDSFFFISGLLVSFLYFRTTDKIDISQLTKSVGYKSNAIQFFGLILYRFCRLTSPYLFILGCVQISMQYFQYNSVFDPPTDDHINCPKYWWRNALYINTLFPVEEMCMLWSWYLADDTQFYILGLVLLITAVSHLKAAAGLLFAFMASSWLTTAYVAYSNNHKPSEDDPLTLFDKIYDKPWTRLGPYLIGMIVGWVLFKCDSRIKMSKVTVCLGWIVSIVGLISLVYGLHGQNLSLLTSSAYSSLSHSAWALCLAWIVIACSSGYGGLINKILSSSSLYPFSRVTYCAYLVHPVVIRHIIITIDSPLHLSQTFMFVLFLGVLSASYGLSFLASLMFEAPIVSLLRLISPKKNRNQ